jgi:hypothetical protein
LERLTNVTEIGTELNVLKNDINLDIPPPAPAAPKEAEVITFTPKPKPVETKKEENV